MSGMQEMPHTHAHGERRVVAPHTESVAVAPSSPAAGACRASGQRGGSADRVVWVSLECAPSQRHGCTLRPGCRVRRRRQLALFGGMQPPACRGGTRSHRANLSLSGRWRCRTTAQMSGNQPRRKRRAQPRAAVPPLTRLCTLLSTRSSTSGLPPAPRPGPSRWPGNGKTGSLSGSQGRCVSRGGGGAGNETRGC